MTRKLVWPILGLMFVSLAGCFLLGARSLVLGRGRHLHLVWNLFLAWLPLWLALGLDWWTRSANSANSKRLTGFGLGATWLLFFPNTFYLVTDLVHLNGRGKPHYWVDLVLVMIFALAGLVLGFLSLFIVQRLVSHRLGWAAGWGFVGGIAVLNGFGVYAGRFLRWNSWDVIASPWALLREGLQWVGQMPARPLSFFLPLLFGALTFLAYVMLYALTHLQTQMGEGEGEEISALGHPRET